MCVTVQFAYKKSQTSVRPKVFEYVTLLVFLATTCIKRSLVATIRKNVFRLPPQARHLFPKQCHLLLVSQSVCSLCILLQQVDAEFELLKLEFGSGQMKRFLEHAHP